jgi:hypothetical protein
VSGSGKITSEIYIAACSSKYSIDVWKKKLERTNKKIDCPECIENVEKLGTDSPIILLDKDAKLSDCLAFKEDDA